MGAPYPPNWNWTALLGHPLFIALIQLAVGIGLGYLLTERWQRWRQRREFQHRTLVKFNELSNEMMDRLAELLVRRGNMPGDVYAAKHREWLSRWTLFASLRGEVMAGYGRQFIVDKHFQGVFVALNALRTFLNAPERVPQEQFEPEQEKFLAHREAVVAHMVHAMGLLSRRDWRSEVAAAETRVRAAVVDGRESLSQTASPETGTSRQ